MKDLKNMEDEEKVTVTEPIATVLSESSFAVDHDGTIILTREMREAVAIFKMALTILYSPQFADSLEAILEFFDERNGSDLDNRYLFLSNKSRERLFQKP